ncbi:MAG: pitrilysin family protein, partial [Halobacteriovoraceae bacterium]|nr:pitrilysin family protein [Halobacteriovoraceae bacterium]
MKDRKMELEKIKGGGGLEALFIHSPGSLAACAQLWFRAGSSLEEKNNLGIAHFLEHMFFKGTSKRPGSAIAREVESFGGEINAFTSFDYTCYYINTPNTHLAQSAEILLDMTGDPLFKEEDIIPERGVVLEEFRRSQDHPDQYLFHRIQESCFLKGYRHAILGVEKTIKNFTRDQLIDFRKKYYNLQNALLIVAGDLTDKKQYLEVVESCQIPPGPASNFSSFNLKKDSCIEIHEKDVKMSCLTLSIESAPFNTDDAAAENLVWSAIGQGESSRLYQDLVIKNTLANTAGSSSMYMANGGMHMMRISFPPENLKKILNELMILLQKVIEKKIDFKEIKKISNQFIASKIYERETIESYSFYLGHGHAQNGNIHSENEFIDRIKNTSLSKVHQSIGVILNRPIHQGLQVPRQYPLQEAKSHLE